MMMMEQPSSGLGDEDTVSLGLDVSSLSGQSDLNRPLLPTHYNQQGTSTFSQSTFNAINVLIGVGVLSLPFALKITGWVIGFSLMVAFMALTNYTARLIARCLDYQHNVMEEGKQDDFGTFAGDKPNLYGTVYCDSEDELTRTTLGGLDYLDDDQLSTRIASSSSGTAVTAAANAAPLLLSMPPIRPKPTLSPKMMTYSEIGMAAFGNKGRVFISVLFTMELFAAAVALIILIADSLHSLFPNIGLIALKLVAFLLVTPTMWLPNLKYLSYGSVLGIISMANLLIVVFIDGISTDQRPGSLLNPADTFIWCRHLFKLPVSFGLIMSGFAGHAVFPNIYREMKEPHRFTSLLNTSYAVTFLVYSLMAAAGYAMFGEETLDEITKNLAAVPLYNAALNTLTIWLIAINPMTKYALTLRPISTNFELWFLTFTEQSSNPAATVAQSFVQNYPLRLQLSANWLVHVPFNLIQILFRTLLSSLVLVVSILFPGFERIISLLGSLFSFIVSVIFPIACYLKLFRPAIGSMERFGLHALLSVSFLMAVTGTIWALLPHDIIGINSRNMFH